jgi:xylulokinase
MKAVLLDARGLLVAQAVVVYDTDLPQFATKGGVLRDPSNPLRVTAPSAMFVAALEEVLLRLTAVPGVDMRRVAAVSGSGQQHGSVYWNTSARTLLRHMSARRGALASQLSLAFALEAGPIWMDSSTTKQCERLERVVGGAAAVAELSGSRAYERFTGNQIAKLREELPYKFAECARISLVSSMMASVLLGEFAPMDASDASGTNLIAIRSDPPAWSQTLLDACVTPACSSRLSTLLGGTVVYSHQVLGNVHSLFAERFGLNPACKVVAFSGDNPCSLVGLRLQRSGDVAVSLGTSDTLFAIVDQPSPRPDGHILRNPIDPHSFMAMLCYKNGSLTRQWMRDEWRMTWEDFDNALERAPPGNRGHMGFFFIEPEITPIVNERRVLRFGPDSDEPVAFFRDSALEVRAVVESQFLSMRHFAAALGLTAPKRIIATGGASKSRAILQVLSDVFNAPVFVVSASENSAALGAALRAMHGFDCATRPSGFAPFHEWASERLAPESAALTLVASPAEDAAAVYDPMLARFAALVRRHLKAR